MMSYDNCPTGFLKQNDDLTWPGIPERGKGVVAPIHVSLNSTVFVWNGPVFGLNLANVFAGSHRLRTTSRSRRSFSCDFSTTARLVAIPIKIDELCIQTDGFCIQTDDLNAHVQGGTVDTSTAWRSSVRTLLRRPRTRLMPTATDDCLRRRYPLENRIVLGTCGCGQSNRTGRGTVEVLAVRCVATSFYKVITL